MKKILGSGVALGFFFGGAFVVMAGSIPAGGACSTNSDCATGLVCGGAPGGGFSTACVAATTEVSGGPTGGGQLVGGDGARLQNPIRYNTFSDLVAAVLQTAVEILMPFVVLAFIWSGFLFVRAQGKPEDLEEAKSAIKWSVVGTFILLGAWGFAQIIGTTVSTLTQ